VRKAAGETMSQRSLPISETYLARDMQYRSYAVKAKFHYAILVADRSEAGRRPVADLLARANSLLAS